MTDIIRQNRKIIIKLLSANIINKIIYLMKTFRLKRAVCIYIYIINLYALKSTA